MKKKRLAIEHRMLIEELLRNKYEQKDVAIAIGVSPSTISREIKNRRTHNNSKSICDKTNRYPFVCVACEDKNYCKKRKYYYSYRVAQKDYEHKLKSSRIGIDMTIDEVNYWDDYFRRLLKEKNQPIMHIFNNVKDEFPKSMQTFYKYVHKGYFPSINSEMLARSFSYKKREKKKNYEEIITIHRNSPLKKGRTIVDFKKYLKANPDASIVEMDSVMGCADDKHCFLTLYFRSSKLMIVYLIDKYNPDAVNEIFQNLIKKLGNELFRKVFEVILTDNGWEFSKPDGIEFNLETGEKLINLFYTDPYSSWQKGSLERNHQFIRYILPKGISLDNITQKNAIDITNNINSVQRKSLNYLTPYDLFIEQYGSETAKLLNLIKINHHKINLSYRILNK